MLRKPTMKIRLMIPMIALTALTAPGLSLHADERGSPNRTVRIFAEDVHGDKRYHTGFDWLRLDVQQKLDVVESVRLGALKLNTVMALPSEIYIAELDRMYYENPTIRSFEIGQVIQGVAISLEDWDDGTDQAKRITSIIKNQSG